MIKKIIGTVLLMIGGLIAIILLTYGGPLLPHIIGPIVLTGAGVLLFFNKKTSS